MTSKTQFLDEKLTNFKKWAVEALPSELQSFKSDIESLNTDKLLIFVMTILKPFKHNIEGFINEKLKENNMTKDDVKHDDYIKLYRYLNCFCDVILN